MLITMAWRNLWRNRQRSWITLSVMVFGLFICLLAFGFGDGAHQQMVRVATSTFMGHIQLNGQGYHKNQKLHIVLEHKSAPVRLLEEALEGGKRYPWQRQIEAWTPRVFGAGLVSTGKNSSGGFLLGIDLQKEPDVTRLPEALLKGMVPQALCQGRLRGRFPKAFLEDVKKRFAARHPKADFCKAKAREQKAILHEATEAFRQSKAYRSTLQGLLKKREVVLGRGLATVLKAKVGGSIAVVSQSLFGAPSDDRFQIVGVVESGNADMDISLCLMSIAALQSLLALEGKYHSLVIRSKSHHGQKIRRLASAIAGSLRTEGFLAQDQAYDKGAPLSQKKKGFEVLPWQRISPELYEFIRADEAGQYFLTVIIFFLVAFVLLNTLQMSIMERTREFGVLMSLGMRGRKLVGLVLLEGLSLGLLSVVLGVALSMPLLLYMQYVGIPLGEPLQMGGIVLELKIKGLITMQGMVFCTGVVLLTTLFVSIFPAYRITRLKPTQALRHV